MTLGPKLYLFSVLSPRICFCFVNPYFLAGCAAFFAILRLAVSKHDLKASGAFFRKFACGLGLAGTVFMDLCPRRATKLWSLQCRHKVLNYYWRCSHSNFISAKPIKTDETLIPFGSESRFAYKAMENHYFGLRFEVFKLWYMLQGAFDHEKSFFHTPKAWRAQF